MATKKVSVRKSDNEQKAKPASKRTTLKATQKKTTAVKTVTPRKTAVRKSVAKKTETISTLSSVNVSPVTSTPSKIKIKLPIRRSYAIAIIAAVIVLVVLYSARSLFVAAVVNGQPVSRLAVVQELEQQGGKQALQSIITNTLIEQEASKRNIVVSQSDVDNEIKTIEANLSKQGQTLDAALQAQGMTRQNLDDQIRIQKMVEKMVGPVTVTDKQISDYIAQNKDSIPEGTNSASVKQQLVQQQLQQKEQAFVQGLQSKAKISYWVSY